MTGWVKSLQCKSRAADDVVPHHHLLPASTSCRFTTLIDVIETTTKKTTTKKPKRNNNNNNNNNKTKPITNPTPPTQPTTRTRPFSSSALTELPEGHPSRNVIEIIFHTSWSTTKTNKPFVPFPVRVEMVFKVQNPTRIVSRFEEYRNRVKTSTGFEPDGECEDYARCLADGNEVMRFYCLGPADCGGVWPVGPAQGLGRRCAWGLQGGKGAAICTFSGSGGAHESAGGGRGRRAMLVCRVVAGRVGSMGRVGFDSVSGDKGELVVFDTRAVLPCFLIIYKV